MGVAHVDGIDGASGWYFGHEKNYNFRFPADDAS